MKQNEENLLPKTRKELLRDVIKYRKTDLVFVSIYCLCFVLPAIVWQIFWSYLSEGVEGGVFNILIQYGVLIPFIMLFGLSMAGALYFWKRLAWNEGSSVHSDFFIGIRKNACQFLIIYLFIGVLYLALHIDEYLLFSNTIMSTEIRYILLGISYVLFFIFLGILSFAQTQAIIYDAKLSQLLMNSLKFVIGKFVKNLGIFLCVFWPFIIYEFIDLFFSTEICSVIQWIIILISGLFYFGFSSLVFELYSLNVFDETINKQHYQEIIGRGLAHESSSEDNNE